MLATALRAQRYRLSNASGITMQFADIAVNLTDPMFQGICHGKPRHEADVDRVVARARERGIKKMLLTGTSIAESREALAMAKKYDLHCTAGVHPTSTSEIDIHPQGAQQYLKELKSFIDEDRGEGGSRRIISIGEVGLDYDRLHHSPRDSQLRYLPELLRLSQTFHLPLFLHSRTPESHTDLVKTLKEVGWSPDWGGGVVHSFTGTREEAKELVDMGLYIGINGCSLKLPDNLEVVKSIPANRLLLETDSPWCSITSTHASQSYLPEASSPLHLKRVKPQSWTSETGVKGRQEPADVLLVAHVVAGLRGVNMEELARQCWENSLRLFWPGEVDGGTTS